MGTHLVEAFKAFHFCIMCTLEYGYTFLRGPVFPFFCHVSTSPQHIMYVMYVRMHGKIFFSSATELVREFSSVLIVFSENNPSLVMSLYCQHYESGSGSVGWLWGCGAVHGWRISEHTQSHKLVDFTNTHPNGNTTRFVYYVIYLMKQFIYNF